LSDNKYYGIYQGVVSNIKDTEKRGRIKVQCPDVLGEVESAWCDPVIPVAYDGGGDFCMPAVEETVWIMFIAGDANRPVWFGNWWQKEMTPIGTNYIKLDDTRIISYKDFSIVVHEHDVTISNCNDISVCNTIKMNKNGIQISSKKDITITSEKNVNVKGSNINLN